MRRMLSLAVVLCLVCLVPMAEAAEPKYVFLFIGDGLGMPQRAATEMYQSSDPNSPGSTTPILPVIPTAVR